MAELAVTSALTLVHLVSPFLEKLNLNKDLCREIKSMENWLRAVKLFIEDNDNHEGSRRIKYQVEQFRDIAYDIEDVLDEFVRHSPHAFHNHKITQQVHKNLHNIWHMFPLKNISDKIAAIKKSIKDIESQNAAFAGGYSSLRPESSSGIRTGHQVSSLLLDEEIVGYEKEKVEFIRQLNDGEKRLVTLAVTGPAGSGKTTFVKNVVWKDIIRGQFDCHAWARMSRHFDVEKLLVSLLKQFCAPRKEQYPSDDSLTIHEKLRKYLGKKSYIVVFDDIWRAEDWNCIKDAFPNALCGSRIIVTTRHSNVASLCASAERYIHILNGLLPLEAFNLFCRKAFQDNNRECPAELKDCSVKIVKRCEGLPLAVVAVGSALAQKSKLPDIWENFHHNLGLGYEIRSGGDSHLAVISSTLLPGYMDLASELKNCFLYFGIFPEDYSVEHGRLIRLWVAERFATGTDMKTAEEVAADYLNELIHRNLVHVSNWDVEGRPRNCRVLNPVHNFIIQKSKDENFAAIFPRENATSINKIRRLSVHGDCTSLSQNINSAGVRSLLLFRCAHFCPDDIWNNSRSFQFSRVVDLQGAPLTEFPRDVSRLTLLRYICFRDTKIETIHKSIAKLLHLEILDLKQTYVTELPKEISELHNLRHLLAYKGVKNYVDFDSAIGVKVYKGINNLTNLQNLSLVRIDQKCGVIKDLKKLRKLRKLGLAGVKREHGADLCESINGMKKLITLDLCSTTKDEYLNLEEMSSPPEYLRRLYLKGPLIRVPPWVESLNNLLRIHLKWSKMKDNPLKTLRFLPNLMEIQMVDCYIGEQLVFEASRFEKLKILMVEDFSRLHTIAIEEGSMPDLQQMSLCRCPNMVLLPLGIQNLGKVKELIIRDMAKESVDRIRLDGEDRWTVEHIPVIHCFTLTSRCWSLENLSTSFYYHRVASSQDP